MVDAAVLRALHVPGDPLVLANVWDAASASLVEQSGFPAVATSSMVLARALGSEDHEVMSASDALAAIRRIAGAVSVPVTADFEAGYGLAAESVAERLLAAGAAGCNLEDSHHRNPSTLVAATEHQARLAAVRSAAGDLLVINARVDTFIHRVPNAVDEAIDRGRRYLDAGADCIYPIAAGDENDIARMVEAHGVVNVTISAGSPSLARCAELGVARASVASGLFRLMTSHVGGVLARLRGGDDTPFRAT